jgi:ABC-2 type transport system ATP-binding protein
LAQQTVLELVREAQQDSRTVFFSSHVLSEVQAVCDRVGIIRAGQLAATERVETLTKQKFHRLRLHFVQMPPADAFAFPGVTEVGRNEQGVILEIQQNLNSVLEAAVPYGVTDIETHPVTLEEVFLAYYGNERGGIHA